jgi:hypothetical protein
MSCMVVRDAAPFGGGFSQYSVLHEFRGVNRIVERLLDLLTCSARRRYFGEVSPAKFPRCRPSKPPLRVIDNGQDTKYRYDLGNHARFGATMKRDRPMTSRIAFFIMVLAMLGFAAGCAEDTVCSPTTSNVGGNLETDVIGTYDGWGTDSPVTVTFEKGGRFVMVEAPNMYAPDGNTSDGTWTVSNGELVMTWGGGARVDRLIVKVFADRLEERNALDMTTDMRSHTRVTCTGYGF